jgi:hypothetical protein
MLDFIPSERLYVRGRDAGDERQTHVCRFVDGTSAGVRVELRDGGLKTVPLSAVFKRREDILAQSER